MTKAEFINKYKFSAIWQQVLFGIPASITLAQGLIESNSGNSTLATQANNLFGIKAYSNPENLPVFYANDDSLHEPFRKYASAKDSIKDHSNFLRNNPRYDSLFNDQNYINWANGLHAAGYATYPAYASTIISVIETNNLQKFDFIGKNKVVILLAFITILALLVFLIYSLTKK